MVGRKNKQPICLRVKRGLTSDFQPSYLDWQVDYAKDITTTGRVSYQDHGVQFHFDKVLEFEANDITRQIDEYTMMCVDVVPFCNYNDYGDYFVLYRFPEEKGVIRVGLEHRQSASIPKLFYLADNDILMFDIDYNPVSNVAYIKRDAYLPLTSTTTIWKRKPSSASDASNKIQLVSTEAVGIDDYTEQFYRLTFEAVPVPEPETTEEEGE
jgi:hypothetical protein